MDFLIPLVNELSTLAVSMVQILGLSWLLPMRRRGLYFAVAAVMSLVICLMFPAPSIVALAHLLICHLLLPGALYDAPIRYRVLALVLGLMPMAAGEAVCSYLWMTLTGNAVGVYVLARPYALVLLALKVLDAAIIVAGMRFLGAYLRRLMRASQQSRAVTRLLPIPVFQIVLLGLMLYMQLLYLPHEYGMAWGVFLLGAASVAVDVLLLATLERAQRAERARSRAKAIQDRLDVYLAQYARIDREVSKAARARHDARNHIQVLRGLIGRGDVEEARRYAAELAGTEGEH